MAWPDMLSGYLHSLPHSLSADGPALQGVSRDEGSVQSLTRWAAAAICHLPSLPTSTKGRVKSQQGYLCQHVTDKDLLSPTHSPKLW